MNEIIIPNIYEFSQFLNTNREVNENELNYMN